MPLLAALLYYGFFGFGALFGLWGIFGAGARSDPLSVILGVASFIGGGYMVIGGWRAQMRGRRTREDERRVYRAIMKGGPVDPQDRDIATAVLRRWTRRSWRLVLLVIAGVCAVWQLYDEIGRLAHAATWTTGALTLFWAAAAVVLLVIARQQILLRLWERANLRAEDRTDL
jgi:hypothetical protein